MIFPNSCVISTETLSEGGKRLAVALNTLNFEPTADGTNSKITVQIASFVGACMVGGYESGNLRTLEGLSRHLAAKP